MADALQELVAPPQHKDGPMTLEYEREKHRQSDDIQLNHGVGSIRTLRIRHRAEKFGTEYRDPGERREFKYEILKERHADRRFATGFDLFTEEEIAKRRQRAERFSMPDSGLNWQAPEVPEDQEKRRQRAERFGTEYTAPDESGLMEVDLLEERKEAPVEAERRLDAVHVYGVDLLSTKDILSYFGDYGPTYVEWINDSSANVLFGDAATAKRAIAGIGRALPPDELPEGVHATDPSNITRLWHKGQDFVKAGSNIPLIFRIATVLDVKPSEPVQSRRLWVTAGNLDGRGRSGRGRGKGRKMYKVRRSSDGGGGGGGGGGGACGRRPPGWEHDDRIEDDGALGRRRGQMRLNNKRKNGDGDVAMADAVEGSGAPQRQRFADTREQVCYDDL